MTKWVLLVLSFIGCSSGRSSLDIVVAPEAAGGACMYGGQRIEVAGLVTYACDQDEATIATVVVVDEAAGTNCASGGKQLVTSVAGATTTSFLCSTQSVEMIATTEPIGASCASGGTRIASTWGDTAFVCGGPPLSIVARVANTDACPLGGAELTLAGTAPVDVCADSFASGVSVSAQGAGPQCLFGGVALAIADGAPSTVCNADDDHHDHDDDITITTVPPGSHCTYGGISIRIDNGTPSYVCNGAPGAAGASVVVTAEPPGTHCTYGGEKMVVGSGPAAYVCNGAPGPTGADGQSVTMTAEPAGAHCPYGGEQLSVGSTVSYVCNGGPGTMGADGESVVMTEEPPGPNCPAGGEKLSVGSETSYVCNGSSSDALTLSIEPSGPNCAAGGVKLQAGTSPPEYICNGSALAWTTITGDAVASGNTGYVVNADSDVALTLPPSSSLNVGDEIRVVAHGPGGVKLMPQAGEEYNPLVYTTNQMVPSAVDVAASQDGRHFVAIDGNRALVSNDAGAHLSSTLFTDQLAGVAISSDGHRSVIATSTGGVFWVSGDFGATYKRASAGLLLDGEPSILIACSSDGMIVVEVAYSRLLFTNVYASIDGGVTWSAQQPFIIPTASFIASSPDALHVMISGNGGTYLSTSVGTDDVSFFSSTAVPVFPEVLLWSDRFGGFMSESRHDVLLSTDSGATWLPQPGFAPSIDRADDGTLIRGDGSISRDGGATWVKLAPMHALRVIASDSAEHWIIRDADTGGVSRIDHGTYRVGAASAIDLIYIGNGEFQIASQNGDISQVPLAD